MIKDLFEGYTIVENFYRFNLEGIYQKCIVEFPSSLSFYYKSFTSFAYVFTRIGTYMYTYTLYTHIYKF